MVLDPSAVLIQVTTGVREAVLKGAVCELGVIRMGDNARVATGVRLPLRRDGLATVARLKRALVLAMFIG